MKCSVCGNMMRLARPVREEGTGEVEPGFEWICDSCNNVSTEGLGVCDVCGRQCLDRKYESGRMSVPIRLPEGCTECVTCNICGQPLGALPRTYNAANTSEASPSSMWSHLGCIAKQREAKQAVRRSLAPPRSAPIIMVSSDQTAGATILTLGILSLFCFGIILGPIAWYMGSTSLGLIESGVADATDRSIILAGRALGIIGTIWAAIIIAIWALYHPTMW